ncbi:hypothetical protein Tco_0055738 [Tanacetum coccineum]
MTGDRSRLMNFVKKFIGTVRFGNDHFGAIMGYGDYVVGDSVISRVYYVERLGHNLFSVGQFCDPDLEVAFRKHSCYVRDTDGVKLLKGLVVLIEQYAKVNPFAAADLEPFVNVFAPDYNSEASSSREITIPESTQLSHPAKAETRGVTSWISS